jgi:hypothetical protein
VTVRGAAGNGATWQDANAIAELQAEAAAFNRRLRAKVRKWSPSVWARRFTTRASGIRSPRARRITRTRRTSRAGPDRPERPRSAAADVAARWPS